MAATRQAPRLRSYLAVRIPGFRLAQFGLDCSRAAARGGAYDPVFA